jgi:hypothetical protein
MVTLLAAIGSCMAAHISPSRANSLNYKFPAQKGEVMAKQQRSDSELAQLTDREISAMIRYLDPNPESGKPTNPGSLVEQDGETTTCIIGVSLILLLGCIGFLFLYYR